MAKKSQARRGKRKRERDVRRKRDRKGGEASAPKRKTKAQFKLGPEGLLLDPEAFFAGLMDEEGNRRLLERLTGLLEHDARLASLRFEPAAISAAEVKARLSELASIEDVDERREEAMGRMLPLLLDDRFRRRVTETLNLAAQERVASISPERKADAEALAFARFLAHSTEAGVESANPLWRSILVLSWQERDAVAELARDVGKEGAEPDTGNEVLNRAMGRLYLERYREAASAIERGEVTPLPLYRMLHLARAYGRCLRRASVARNFGLAPEELQRWLAERVSDCVTRDLDKEFLAREAVAVMSQGRVALEAGEKDKAQRLLAAHAFLADEEANLSENPFIRLHYFESLRRLLDAPDGSAGTDAEHARALVGEPDAREPIERYLEALRGAGEDGAASRLDKFIQSELG